MNWFFVAGGLLGNGGHFLSLAALRILEMERSIIVLAIVVTGAVFSPSRISGVLVERGSLHAQPNHQQNSAGIDIIITALGIPHMRIIICCDIRAEHQGLN